MVPWRRCFLNGNRTLAYSTSDFGWMRTRLQDTTPSSGPPLKAGELILGYSDEAHNAPPIPQPDVLSRNGSYIAYRRMQKHVGKFRDFLRANGESPEEQELIAAKLMGRWRSGAPLALCPLHDNPELGADPRRNNDFLYEADDPIGFKTPAGSHIRRRACVTPPSPKAACSRSRNGAIRSGHKAEPAQSRGPSPVAAERACPRLVVRLGVKDHSGARAGAPIAASGRSPRRVVRAHCPRCQRRP